MAWTLDEISDLVGHRRYCFIVTAYGSGASFFNHLASLLQDQCGLRTIRADQIPSQSELLQDRVHQLIDNAELVIADLSEPRPNLYYEVGYARARGRRVLIICRRGTELAVDLHGTERIEYEDTLAGVERFDAEIRHHVMALLESERRLLRAMLIAPSSLPSCLLASPRWHTARTASEDTRERRTYGDSLGVVGILSAFGALLGQDGVPELISAQHAQKDILEQDCNLYLVGSPRANRLTADALALAQQSCAHPWRFVSSPDSPTSTLSGFLGGREWRHEADHAISVPPHDYGLLVRGPHPRHPGRIIFVLAGTRSLGTGGICLAATRPRRIQEIRDRLTPVPLDDREHVIWALVRARPDPDNHAHVEYIDVEGAGVCS